MSYLIVAGLNYHSAPISIREQFAIPSTCLDHALTHLKQLPHVLEAAVLSTCNRTEVYAVVSDIQAGWRELETFFAATRSIGDHEVLRPDFKLLGDDVALHLMRVASGLNSMVVGEGQILAQLKAAHQAALEAKAAGPILDHTFSLAISCGKRVRTETGIGRRAVSASSAALEVGRDCLGTLKDKRILLIGAGQMAHLCLKQLVSEVETGKITVVNRDRKRVQQLLQAKFQGSSRLAIDADYDERHRLAADSDLVIVATSAPEYVIVKDELNAWLRGGRRPAICMIDISVPRNIDPEIGGLERVQLFNADDLSGIVSANLVKREALVADAEKIIFEALAEFQSWQRSLRVVPTISALRERMECIRREQTEKVARTRVSSDEQYRLAQFDYLGRSIVSRILHDRATSLKAMSVQAMSDQQKEVIDLLFNLNSIANSSTTLAVENPYKSQNMQPLIGGASGLGESL